MAGGRCQGPAPSAAAGAVSVPRGEPDPGRRRRRGRQDCDHQYDLLHRLPPFPLQCGPAGRPASPPGGTPSSSSDAPARRVIRLFPTGERSRPGPSFPLRFPSGTVRRTEIPGRSPPIGIPDRRGGPGSPRNRANGSPARYADHRPMPIRRASTDAPGRRTRIVSRTAVLQGMPPSERGPARGIFPGVRRRSRSAIHHRGACVRRRAAPGNARAVPRSRGDRDGPSSPEPGTGRTRSARNHRNRRPQNPRQQEKSLHILPLPRFSCTTSAPFAQSAARARERSSPGRNRSSRRGIPFPEDGFARMAGWASATENLPSAGFFLHYPGPGRQRA